VRQKLPANVQSWRRVWGQVIPFFACPLDIQKIICTTNVIESLHMQLRKVLNTRGHFPNEEAATKLIYRLITLGLIPAHPRLTPCE
jgi:putative transposase